MVLAYVDPIPVVGAAEEAASKNGGAQMSNGGRPRTCRGLLMEALFYRLRNAGPWRDLPSCFGPWSTVHYWHSRWAKEGLWRRLLEVFSKKSRGKVRLVDGTHIRVHQCATNPAGGAQNQAMGKTRGGRNTKLMAMTEAHGKVVALALVEGQAYEAHHVAGLLRGDLHGLIIVGDKAYDDDGLRRELKELGHEPCFPGKKNRRVQPRYRKDLYRTRYRIENLFCRLKAWASVATRRDKLARNFLSLVQFASVIDRLKPQT